MTAKEANAKYVELLGWVAYNSNSIFYNWQRSKGINIPNLVRELRVKEKKAIYTIVIATLVNIAIAVSLTIGAIQLDKTFSKDHYRLFFIIPCAVVVLLFLYVADRIREVYILKAIEEKRKVSVELNDNLTLLEKDLSLFAHIGEPVCENNINSKVLYTATRVVEVQNRLLRLTLNGSVMVNIELVKIAISDFNSCNTTLCEQIEAARLFGIVIDRNTVLRQAS